MEKAQNIITLVALLFYYFETKGYGSSPETLHIHPALHIGSTQGSLKVSTLHTDTQAQASTH